MGKIGREVSSEATHRGVGVDHAVPHSVIGGDAVQLRSKNMRSEKELVERIQGVNKVVTVAPVTQLGMYSIGFMHGIMYAMGIDKEEIPNNETTFAVLVKELADKYP